LETPFCSGIGWGESGKGEEAHHDANSERKRLRTEASRGGRGVPAAVSLCARTEGSRNEKRGTGEEEEARGSLCPLLIRARSRGVDRGGSGGGFCGFQPRARGNRASSFGEGDEPDEWAPPVSRQRERGGREGEPAGPWPRKGRGVWAKMAEKKEGGEKGFFLFIFQQIFKLFFK